MDDTKSKIQTWLAVVNIVLTIVIGIGITLFLDYRDKQFQSEMKSRDEQFQIRFAELKAQLDSQINLTTLSVFASSATQFNCAENYIASCGSLVTVKNIGNVPAKNVKIIVALEAVGTPWKDVIKDINAFSYSIYPPINSQVKPIRINNFDITDSVYGDNAIEITIDNLPSNSSVNISFRLASTIQLKKFTSNQTTILYRHDTEPIFSYVFRDLVIKYNGTVLLEAFGYCDNCKDAQDNPIIRRFTVSKFNNLEINKIEPIKNFDDSTWTSPTYAWSVDMQLECMTLIGAATDVCELFDEVFCDADSCDYKLGQ